MMYRCLYIESMSISCLNCLSIIAKCHQTYEIWNGRKDKNSITNDIQIIPKDQSILVDQSTLMESMMKKVKYIKQQLTKVGYDLQIR